MTMIELRPELVKRLERIAAKEQRSLEATRAAEWVVEQNFD